MAPFATLSRVLLLNTGAHAARDTSVYQQNLRQVYQYLNQSYTGTVLFRTTPRGHLNCTKHEHPIQSVNDLHWKRFFPSKHFRYSGPNSFHYDRFPEHNRIAKEIFGDEKKNAESQFKSTVLDIATMSELRPDSHSDPPKDCLHYKGDSGVFDAWMELIFNALQGHLQ
jgi:hypothetical protein